MRRRFRSVFALVAAVMLLVTSIFQGAAPIYAAVNLDKPNVEVDPENTEEENQTISPIQHEQPEQLALGEDFKVEVSVPDMEEVSLFYKQDANAEATVLPMKRSENSDLFTAVIPGKAITDSTMEYWFEVTNGEENITSLPYIVEVKEGENPVKQEEEPPSAKNEEELTIEHEPIKHIDSQANITIETTVKQAKEVTLQFQTGKQMAVQELPFTQVEGTENYTVEVPATAFWSPDFQYNIIAVGTDGAELTYPQEGYIEASVSIEEPDPQSLPPLLITEITPNQDGYGFIEIYNNGDQPINMKNYQLTYRDASGETDQVWDLTEDNIIPSKESFIVWVQDQELTIEDFNTKYDLALTEDRITTVEASGLANSNEQSLILSDDANNEIAKATYNEEQPADQGIVYKYPLEGNVMQHVGLGKNPTPGSLLNGQVPSESVAIEIPEAETDTEAPIIGEPSVSLTDDAVTVEIEVMSEQELTEVNVHISQSSAFTEQVLPMQLENGSVYTLTIPLDQIWSERVQYYFTASNETGTSTSESFEATIPQPEVDSQTVPELLITELAPNTENMNGVDAYEFIEIYNNTDQPINMKDYKIIYRYPTETADQIWDITDDKVIESQESFIIWIHNDGNRHATLDDFNNQYGLNLTEDHVAIIESDGMANGSERTLILADEFDNEITQASYNDGSEDVFVDRGVIYKYPNEGSTMEKIGVAQNISPLTVFPEQVPDEPVHIEAEADVPVISEPSINVTEEEITAQVDVTSEQAINGVNLYVAQSEAMGFEAIPMTKSDEASTYTASIPRSEIWSDTLHYYIVAANQSGEATTEIAEFAIPHADVDYQAVPPLFITEVVPDSTNVNGADAYEFIEVYNNTTEPINYNDYIIRYRYPNSGPDADLLWGPPANHEDIIIPPGETVVFWIINSGNTDLTGADFNAHYGTNLTEGSNLIKIYNNGMSNSAERTFVMATKSGYELSNVRYIVDGEVDDTVANKGILFRYPTDGSPALKKISAGTLDATPGQIIPEQVPPEKVQLPEDTVEPVIKDTTEKDIITSEEPVQITATITDNIQVKSVTLNYRTIDGEDFKQVNLERSAENTYEHIIYEPELIGQKELDYYFTASDGRNESTTEVKTVPIEHPNMQTGLRLNVEEGELISGKKIIKATEDKYTEDMSLFLDKEQVTDTFMAMENEAYFAFDVSETNIYFQNGVTMGDEILEIFDDTYTDFVTLTVPIAPDMLKPGENTITIRAGNKVSPFDETSTENRDDFTIKNVRLVLEDGTVIYDPNYRDPETNYSVGDSPGKDPVYDFTFTIDAEKFASLAYLFDTTTVSDGDHELKATLGDAETTTNVVVDNTAPVIKSSLKEGKEYKGDFTIDAEVKDASDIAEITTTLDGEPITLPHKTSSAQLAPGEHEVVYTATDAAGNTASETITFSVVEEHPWLPDWIDKQPEATSAELSVKVNDPTGDKLNVDFYQSYQYTADDIENISISHNSVGTEPPEEFLPEGEMEFTENDLALVSTEDGTELSTESTTEFPYHRFDVTVDKNVQPEDEIEIVWNGSSLEGRKVTMYAWNYSTSEWDALTSVIAGNEAFELVGSVTGEAYLQDGKVSIIVQDQISDPGENFSFVWMSDTQYYSESYPYIYQEQVEWIAENQEELNLEYVIHTGDIVNVWDDFNQWEVADQSMKVLDDAGIPYGVLAGNHDVDQKDNNYTNYYTYFGDHRFEDRSYFGGSYENNRGHYDLISVNGNDFIIVYMGWGVDQAGIDWINDVLEAHPNHKAILGFHEYLLASGTRSPIGDELFEKVVIPNENVHAVLSGHYHNSQRLLDEIDDDGDGTADRTVYQILADYQGGPEGGQGYMRLLTFNMETNQMEVRTYSPYMDDYNYYDPEEFPGKDEFNLDWDLEPQMKKVATDYVEVNVYTNNLIDSVENVKSGETATVVWENLAPNREYFWHVIASDEFGGMIRSDIWNFKTVDGEIIEPPNPEVPEIPEPEDPEKPEYPGGDPDDGKDKDPGDKPNEELPNNNKQTVTPEVENNKATLDNGVFDDVADGGNIIVDLNAYAELALLELELTEEQVKQLQAKNIVLTILKGDISMDIPSSAFSGTGDAVIKIERLKQIDDALSNVYDITITHGDKAIEEFSEPITLTLDVFADNVTNPEHLHLYHLNEDANEWQLVNGSELANNQVTAPLHHLSTFAAFEEADDNDENTNGGAGPGSSNGDGSGNNQPPKVEKTGTGSGSGLGGFLPDTATNMFNYLLIGIVLLVSGAGIWYIGYYRKQRLTD